MNWLHDNLMKNCSLMSNICWKLEVSKYIWQIIVDKQIYTGIFIFSFDKLPRQLLPSSVSRDPGGQIHLNPPTVFSHLPLAHNPSSVRHSFLSVTKIYITRGSEGCVVHISFCFEETLYRAFHRCFLPNFGSFGYSVSEEKIFLVIDQPETRIAYGGHVC